MSETSEAATRRRWVTLAEGIAVAGLLIGALTLWLNWSDKRDERAAAAAAREASRNERTRVDLIGSAQDDGRTLTLRDERHDLSEATIVFPRPVGIPAQHPSGDPVIQAAWFAHELLTMTDGGPDTRTGRLPVLITVHFIDGDTPRNATAIYDIIWRIDGRMLRGREVKLEGLRLRERGGDQAALDALWARLMP